MDSLEKDKENVAQAAKPNVKKKKEYYLEGWTIEELEDLKCSLQLMSRTTLRTNNRAVELLDGKVRIAILGEDKKWSEWETYEAPHLVVGNGKLVMMFNQGTPILWKGDEDAMELWVYDLDNDRILEKKYISAFCADYGSEIIRRIGHGDYGSICQLVTIPYTNSISTYYHYNLDGKMNLSSKIPREDGEDGDEYLARRRAGVDMAYRTGDWVKYLPLETYGGGQWVPAQEIEYIDELISKLKKAEKKAQKEAEKKTIISKEQHNGAKHQNDSTQSKGTTKTNAKFRVLALIACVVVILLVRVFYTNFLALPSPDSSTNEETTEMVEDASSDISEDTEVTERLEGKYDLVAYDSDGLYQVAKDDYYGLCDHDGKEICKPQFDFIGNVEDGVMEVSKNDKWGFINVDGKIIVPCEYEFVHCNEGMLECTKGDNTLLFDKEGNLQENKEE